MKNLILVLISVSSILGMEKLVTSPIPSSEKIGDVRYSMIPPPRFQEENPGWVLMDGREVKGTKYADLTGLDTIPDATNKFLRGMGGTYDAADGGLNGKKRTVGSFQGYATSKPISDFKTDSYSGEHFHHINQLARVAISGNGREKGEEFSTPGMIKNKDNVVSPHTDTDGLHEHTIGVGGDPETRPSNIAIYVYIKVDGIN